MKSFGTKTHASAGSNNVYEVDEVASSLLMHILTTRCEYCKLDALCQWDHATHMPIIDMVVGPGTRILIYFIDLLVERDRERSNECDSIVMNATQML